MMATRACMLPQSASTGLSGGISARTGRPKQSSSPRRLHHRLRIKPLSGAPTAAKDLCYHAVSTKILLTHSCLRLFDQCAS